VFLILFLTAVIAANVQVYAQTKDLQVTTYKPSGFLYDNVKEITIIFNEDIVEKNKGDDLNPPVKIFPEIEGRWVWKSSRQITFYPDDKLDQNRKYNVKVKKGLKSIDNKYELKKDFAFVFVNNSNRVVSVMFFSNNSYSNSSRMYPSDTISLTFVHSPLSADVDRKILVYDKSTNKEVPIKIKFQKDTKTVNIIFKKPLKWGKDYRLEVDYTLRSDVGDMGLASDYNLDFRTRKEMLLLSHSYKELDPDDGVSLVFSEYIDYDDLLGKIRVISGRDTLKSEELYIWHDYDEEVKSGEPYKLSFYKEGEKEYKIILPKGYGKVKNQEYQFKIKTLPNTPDLRLNGETFLLESYKSGIIPVKAVNVDSLAVVIYRINENDSQKIISKNIPVSTKKNKHQTIPLYFKELISGKSGYYSVSLTNKKSNLLVGRYHVNFTRYALMAKIAYNKIIVLAYDLETGKPVKDGEVFIPKKNLKGRTDKNGTVEFNSDFEKMEMDGYANLMIFFRNGEESSVLKIDDNAEGPDGNRSIYTSYGYRRVYDNNWSLKYYREGRIGFYLYTDRGLYKPGEVAYIKGIVREINGSDWVYAKDKNVEVSITDSRNKEIMKLKAKLNEYGTFAFACTLNTASPTGSYSVHCTAGGRDAYENFRVEEFKPLEFDVKMASNNDNIYYGDNPMVSVSGRYLFGSPMNGDSIRWKISSSQYRFSPKGFSGWSFSTGYSYEDYYYDDYYYGYRNLLFEGESALDSAGMFMIKKKIMLENNSNPMMITYFATVKSASGQEITRSTNMIYHPTDTYIGLKMDRYVYDSKNNPVIKIIAVNPNGDYLKGKSCDLLVLCERYISVQKTGTYGRTYWENSYVQDTIVNKRIDVKNGFTDFEIKEELKTGYYSVTAHYSEEKNSYNVNENFYFCGDKEGWWQMRDDNYIEVIPDKKSGEYEIGDKAKIFVKTPYKDLNGYVTIEREGIYKKFPVKIKSNAHIIEVPITEEMLPNAYFSIFVYKGRSSNEIKEDTVDLGKPYFGVGFCNLKVSSEKRRQSVEIKIDKESYKPQETVKGSVQVLNSSKKGTGAEVSIAVVDLGILNLIGFETPNPFKEFYKNRNHDVSMATNAGDIVGERNYGEKGENRGGDGGMDKFRAEFLPIIYFKAQVATDASGKADFEFKLPDNLTTFRIMAVSCNETDFGNGEKDFIVKKDFMLNQSLPNFVRDGDTFIGGAVAVNMTEKDGDYRVECTAEGAEIIEQYNDSGMLKSGEKKEILCKFLVDTDKDTVVLKFKGALNSENDNLMIKLPVRKNPLIHFAGIYESTEERENMHQINLSEIKKANLKVTFSSTGMNDIKEATRYLFDYPYGCLEQRTSKVFPLIIGEDLINTFDIGEIKGKTIKNIVKEYLNMLSSYQQQSGGFSIWTKQGDPVNPYLTNYVVYIMNYAKKNGYKIDENVYANALNYVRTIAGGTAKSPYFEWYSHQSTDATKLFSTYLLKLAKQNYDSYIQQYADKVEQMSGEGLGWLLLLINGDKKYDKIRARVFERINVLAKYEGMYAYFEIDEKLYDEIYSSSVKTTSLIMYALLEEKGKKFNDAEKFIFWLLKRRSAGGYWSNTQDNAFAIMAMDKYFKVFESSEPNFKASVSVDKKKIFEEAFKGYSLQQSENETVLEGASKKEVTVNKTGEGRLYYSLIVSYGAPSEIGAINNGFEVTKAITPYQHDSNEFIRGRMYKVTLHIKTESERMYVAVDDPVPAGFEIVNTAFATNEGITEDQREYYGWWFGNFNHTEKYFDRYVLFADWLNKGEYTKTYYIKAIYPGKYYMPPTKAEEMYTPGIYGSSESKWVEIK
jgi:hypothetical protein